MDCPHPKNVVLILDYWHKKTSKIFENVASKKQRFFNYFTTILQRFLGDFPAIFKLFPFCPIMISPNIHSLWMIHRSKQTFKRNPRGLKSSFVQFYIVDLQCMSYGLYDIGIFAPYNGQGLHYKHASKQAIILKNGAKIPLVIGDFSDPLNVHVITCKSCLLQGQHWS